MKPMCNKKVIHIRLLINIYKYNILMKGKIMKKGIVFFLIVCISSSIFAATRKDLGFGVKYANYKYLARVYDYTKEINGTMLSMSYENSFEKNASITNFINADLLLTSTVTATHSYMLGYDDLTLVEENFFGRTNLNITAMSLAVGVRKYITLIPLLDVFLGAGFRSGVYNMFDEVTSTPLQSNRMGRLSVGYIFDYGVQFHITEQLSFNLAGTYGFDFFVFYYEDDFNFINHDCTGEITTANAYVTYRF